MHTYDVPGRRPFQPVPPSGSPHRSSREVPASRPVQNPQDSPSPTPIYDALHAEWVRSFRTLPGDRHGEEDLGFKAFGSLGRGSNSYSSSSSYNSYSSYSAGAQTARQIAAQHGQTSTATAVWQPGARQHGTGMHHIPAALPPAPRRGL
ncbi:hypothetical protein OHB05_09280 [Streptomyces sp. NBC_00638]|nr:hypothetical protein [Streptomyces sp. NBC_00568]MCX5002820.1 hypothetical protein [Streptomyces sp. NBC_00638]